MSLKEYKEKRNFNKTSEPSGEKKKVGGKKEKVKELIFCVQYHEASTKHYDFRLEFNGALLSFAVPKGPSFNPKDKRLAVKVEDHPIDYATFEGVIPKGEYGGGVVMLWDIGTFIPLNSFKTGLKKGALKFELFGEKLKGKWTLIKLKNEKKQENWLLIKENDKFIKTTSGISKLNKSVKSGLKIGEIKEKREKGNKIPFKKVDVKLAKLVTKLENEKEYLYEIKYDGYRIVAFVESGKAKLLTRNNLDYTSKFKNVAKKLEEFFKSKNVVLDGEMVVLDKKGRSNFQMLQNHLNSNTNIEPVFMAFDILFLNGEDLREEALINRKQILENNLKNAPSLIQYSSHILYKGNELFKEAEKLGLEGIIGKKINSKYNNKRDDDWIKLKCYKRQEFVIGGFIKTNKKDHGIGALLLGYYENNKLLFIGKAGTGINQDNAKVLHKNFKNLILKNSPFYNFDKESNDIVYLKPKLICEIQYAEITSDNLLRQASFKGLRADKSSKNVVLEEKKEVKVLGVKISNPNKIVFEKENIRKIDIINYYKLVGEKMLKYIENRLLSVVRCTEKECFYKKHPNYKSEYIKTKKVKGEVESEEYFYINSLEGLILEAQNGTIEFHPWGSLVQNLNNPNVLVFDLDPDENLTLDKVREGVKDLKKLLDNLKLKSFLKTSGNKGYHIIVPFNNKITFEKLKEYSKKIAESLEEMYPDKYTTNMRKENRKGKIFIDYFRNGKGSTSVAPYSVRKKGGKVSMPIKYSELYKFKPNHFDIFNAVEKIKKTDPWKDFFNINQNL